MDLKIIQSLSEKVQICKKIFWKPKNVQELEDFSEDQQEVELLRTSAGLMKNYLKTKKQSGIIQETTHSIKIQGYVNFWTGSFLWIQLMFFLLECIYKLIVFEIAYSGQY